MKKPNLFLIGAAKCGTTSLYHYLKQHPDLFFPEHKEPHYFSKDLEWRYQGTVYRSLEEYLTIFEPAQNEKWVGEASVWHLYSKVAAQGICDFNPHAKILCLLRNPVDMMHSMYRFGVRRGHENAVSFRKAIELEPQRTDWSRVPRTLFLLSAVWYNQIANFGEQIERYTKLFPRENIKFLLTEDLSRAPEKVVNDVLDFLGITPSDAIDYTPQNVTAENQLSRLEYMSRFSPRAAHQIGKFIPSSVKSIIRSSLGNSRRPEPVDAKLMPDDLRKELLERHRESIEKTAQLIDRDLSHWLEPILDDPG